MRRVVFLTQLVIFTPLKRCKDVKIGEYQKLAGQHAEHAPFAPVQEPPGHPLSCAKASVIANAVKQSTKPCRVKYNIYSEMKYR